MCEQAEEVKTYDNADKRKSYIWMAWDGELEDIFQPLQPLRQVSICTVSLETVEIWTTL